jgi:hypothetical protein
VVVAAGARVALDARVADRHVVLGDRRRAPRSDFGTAA